MAGIGWRLERLIDQGSLSAAVAAYATGAAVMALPWVFTTAVLASLPVVIGRGLADFTAAHTVITVAYSTALLVDGPFQVVISRYTADRLYEGRLTAIAAPLCNGLGVVLLGCGLVATSLLAAQRLPPLVVVGGGALAAAVGGEWVALSVGNGLCSPAFVLGAVGGGAALSFLLAAALVAFAGLGVPGYLLGLAAGQTLTLAVLLAGILRALPDEVDETAALRPAFRDYFELAGAGLAFNAALWVDRFMAWCLVGVEEESWHAAASTLAWFCTIPCLAWIFVEVETAFHRRFREFFLALEGGASLGELRRGTRLLIGETRRLLRGAIGVQAGVTALFELAADPWIRLLGLPAGAVPSFRFLLLGAGFQALTLLGLILLYHFDRRRDALISAASLLAAVAALTAAAAGQGWPPGAGMALGSAIGAAVTWHRAFRGTESVLRDTLLGQPFGTERMPPAGSGG